MKQKQRSERFLARRGIATARQVYSRDGANNRHGRSAAELLVEARAQHSALAAAAQGGSGNTNLTAPWQPVGPAHVTTAVYGALTGRVSSIAIDPSDPSGNTVYVGTTGGGMWRSANAAGNPAQVTFTPLTDTNIASLSIGAVSVQPGGTGVVLAGTGDPNDATDSYYGAGILRSDDSGVTWNLITQSSDVLAGGKQDFTFSGNGFAGFAWSTATPGLVVAAVSQAAKGVVVNAGGSLSVMGIYYSQDAGKSWYMANIADSGTTVQSNQTAFLTRGNAATSVVWNPVRGMFYAAVRFHGYYQSADGINWARMAYQPGSGLTTDYCPSITGSTGSTACPIFRGALAVQPVTGDMFALTTDLNNLDQGLWQDVCALNGSTCSSATVTFANRIGDAALEAGSGDTTIPQADYDLYLAVVPSGQDTLLFAGTEDVYKCSLANNCAWRNTTHSTTCASAQVAWAQHAIDATLGVAGPIYFGNDGGLWRTTDAVNQQQNECSADDASHYQNLNDGLGSLAEVENIADDAGNAQNMMVSLGALGTAAATAGVGTAWPQVLDGEGNYAAIDPAAATNWYATSEFGVGINRCTEGSGCDIAGFGQPVIASTQVAGDQQDIPAPWILDPQDTANVIVGTCRVWRGPATGGSAWSTNNLLSGMLDTDQEPYCDGNAEIRSLAASGSASDPPGTAEQLYAGMAGLLDGRATVPGHIFTASVANGSGSSTTWTDLFHSPVADSSPSNGHSNPNGYEQFNPGGFDISSIYVDPHDPTGQTVYATVQGFSGNGLNVARLYGSTDGGAIWSNLTNNLPDAPANSVVVDPNDANTIYVATDTGVYVTRNISSCAVSSTPCWSVFGTSLPNAPVIQLAALNEGSTSVLRAATYGRGVWEIGLVTAGTAQTTAKAAATSLTFPSQQVGALSATQTVAIINTGTITLNVSHVSITGDFAQTDNCASPVLPGDACTVNVTFNPSQTGARTGLLTVYGNISGGSAAGQVTVSLSGTGAPGAAILLSPQTLTFPETLLGKTAAAQDVTISNTGGVAASLTSESVTGDFSITANTCGASLATNTGCTLSIAYSPTVSGNETGMLKVFDSTGTQTLQLTGMGEAPATDGLAPLSLTFAPQAIGLPGSGQQVTLTNDGDQALDQIAIQLHGDFSAVNRCGASLTGHSTCAIVVSFVPTQTGAESGTLTVTDILRSQTVTLAGTGLPPPRLMPAPVSVDFGTYTVGQTSTVQTVTLTNSGGVPLNNVTTNMTGDFAVAPGLNNCPPTLAVGAQCQVGMVFSPSQAGALSGSLTVTATELSKPLLVPLTGTGVPASGVSAT
ncbi:MAG TPA: choice-of-anchor D domain-containing protein, partial [Acetobacteraceae bacterium]|nr:choice-of-anchor D domain-containing protein [Acetobacteraceae bacterium]